MVAPVKIQYPHAPQRLMSDKTLIESKPQIFSKLGAVLNKNVLDLHQATIDDKSMQAIKDILVSLKEIGQAFLNSNEVIEDLSFHLDMKENALTYSSVNMALSAAFNSSNNTLKKGDMKTLTFKSDQIPSCKTMVAGLDFDFKLSGFQGIICGFTNKGIAIISINPILKFETKSDPEMKFSIAFDSTDGKFAFVESIEKLNKDSTVEFGVRFIPPGEKSPRNINQLIWGCSSSSNPTNPNYN
jgi:hypothetical protein